MKRTMSVMLAICLLVMCLPLSAAQAATSMRGDLYRLINQERVKAGLSALNTNSYLNACSAIRIEELFQSPSHTRPDGRDWRTVLEDKNLPVDVAYSGEIWCGGYSTAASALEAFMNSSDHREILMDDKFNFMGVGHGVQNGADYWVVNFTRSSELQPENDCFGKDDDPTPNPPSGNVSLAMYYGDVTMKDGKVLLSEDSPALKCWLQAPRGSYFESWSVTVTDQQKNPIFNSGECPEEQTLSGSQKALSLMMWKEPENGALVYPSCRLEPGKDYYYRFDAIVNGKTYSSQYVPFIVDGEPAADPVTLTLTEKPGSDGAVLVNAGNPALHATLSAPVGSKLTYSLSIYPLNSDTPIAKIDESRTGTTTLNPSTIGFTVWKTPVGNQITYSNFSLSLGETYRYDLTAIVNGKTYTTPKGKFRLPSPETKTYTVTFFNPINGTSSTKTVTNGQPYGTLPTPASVSGYTFEGWYADTDFTQRVTKDTIVNLTKDQTLYARMVREEDKTVSLTLADKTGLNGVQTVSPYNGKFEATLSAPSGCTVTQHSFNVYTTGGKSLGSQSVPCNEITNGTNYSIYRTLSVISGTVTDGATLTWGSFKLTAGSTYLYDFSVVVDGKTYTTQRAHFRISANSGSSISFTDVKSNAYYANAVKWAVENDITSGTGNNKFSPDTSCTRGQIVTFLWRAAGSPAPKTTSNPFTDVKPSDYYYKAVLWAVENNITSGIGNGKFGPGNACTRGQAVTFLWRAAGSPGAAGAGKTFKDVNPGSYYENAVKWAVANDVTSGTSATTFSPNQYCTRGQIVTFLYRANN